MYPVVVDSHEQLALARCDRSGIVTGVEQLGERAHVHPQPIALERDGLARRREAVGALSEGGTQLRERRPQTRPCARVEHVWPEQARKPSAGVPARIQREPGEQAPPAPRAREVERRAIQLQPQSTTQTYREHGAKLRDGQERVADVHAGRAVAERTPATVGP